MNVALNAGGGTANLIVNSDNPTFGSLGSDSISTANVTLGTGTNPVTLTLTGANAARFVGNITTAGSMPLNIVKSGAAAQSLIGAGNAASVALNGGVLELSAAALGNATVNLTGGTLQMIANGLTLQAWDSDPGASGAYGGTLDTFAGVQAHYAALNAPAFITNTANDGNTVISYDPTGDANTRPI